MLNAQYLCKCIGISIGNGTYAQWPMYEGEKLEDEPEMGRFGAPVVHSKYTGKIENQKYVFGYFWGNRISK